MTAEKQAAIFESALRMISTAGSVGGDPLSDAYLEAGGGYGGLQAIAVKALEIAEVYRTSLHDVPPEVRRLPPECTCAEEWNGGHPGDHLRGCTWAEWAEARGKEV